MIPERTVTVALMCEARERRVERRAHFRPASGLTLISFTLNIPGNVKDGDLYRKAHREGMRVAAESLRTGGGLLARKKVRYPKTGTEGLFAVDAPAADVKARLMEIERKHPLGRLFDFDVFDPDDKPLSRSDTALFRTCYMCSENAKACARSGAHPVEEILERITRLIESFFGSDSTSTRTPA